MLCFTLEDGFRAKKVKGETRIPPGTYDVRFRREGPTHARYLKRYPDWHDGMLHLQNVPQFRYVLLHVGNEKRDTRGCLLVGLSACTVGADWELRDSRKAYEKVYPVFANQIRAHGFASLQIKDHT